VLHSISKNSVHHDALTTEDEDDIEDTEVGRVSRSENRPRTERSVRKTAVAPSLAMANTENSSVDKASPVPVTNYLTPDIVLRRRLFSYDRETHLCPLITTFVKQVIISFYRNCFVWLGLWLYLYEQTECRTSGFNCT